MKNQKGITLIALIITIIVMLILVGVSVTVALNGGLFTSAKKARENTEIERDKELALDEGKVEIDGVPYDSINQFVDGTTPTPPTPETPTTYEAYEVGDVVTLQIKEPADQAGTEQTFYVIEDSDETQSTVKLLAKYNLNKAGTEQLNATRPQTSCRFSSTNYWDGQTTGYPLNLNNYPITGEGVTSIVTTAQVYGTSVGGEGKLLTHGEATILVEDHEGIILGTTIGAEDGYLQYWLGTAGDEWGPYGVLGDKGTFEHDLYDYIEGFAGGVRPVVEISKAEID